MAGGWEEFAVIYSAITMQLYSVFLYLTELYLTTVYYGIRLNNYILILKSYFISHYTLLS